MKKEVYEALGAEFPPQSSLKLVSHGNPEKPESFYYTWEIKIYHDDMNEALELLRVFDEKLRKLYGKR